MSGALAFAKTPQRVLISGSSGLLGRHIAQALQRSGHTVVPLVRGRSAPGRIFWDPRAASLSPASVSGFDTVIHLAGEPVLSGLGRWTVAKKRRIYESRVKGTATLAAALANAAQPPRLFFCASGINVYGDHGDGTVDESTPSGSGFLAEVCRAWEAAATPLEPVSRVIHMRIGVVLSAEGGMLAALLPFFRAGLGAVVGDGRNYVSWIGLHDFVCAVQHLMVAEPLSGAVNLVSPEPVTTGVFSRDLALAVRRRVRLRIPAFLVRAALGQLAEETMLSSVRALPNRLLATGFRFAQPALPAALANAFHRRCPAPTAS